MNFKRKAYFSILPVAGFIPIIYFVTVLSNSYSIYSLTEICENAIDDDEDGLIDLNDPDCTCEIIETISLIPNPSFEDMNCCPNNRSQLNCADVWIQASEPTTDYLHTCGWMGWPEFPPPQPFPDGQGIMGFRDGRVRQGNNADTNWKEYAGACLLSPLETGTLYRFEFDVGFVNTLRSPPIDISFFGTTDCKNLPFGRGNDAFGCPINGPGWVRLGSAFVSGDGQHTWIKTNIEVIPKETIRAIAIGPDCPAVLSDLSLYYFFDNLILADIRAFELKITEVLHPCNANFHLKIPNSEDYTYQWFKDGIALVTERASEMTKMYGEGNYQVRIRDNNSCRLTSVYKYKIPIITTEAHQTICKDELYRFGKKVLSESGNYIETFKSGNNCDSIVSLNLKILGSLEDTVEAKIFPGESYRIGDDRLKQEGDHVVQLVSSIGCDSLVLVRLDYYKMYLPNIFSPNEDGINDLFSLHGADQTILKSELSVFDSWGNIIFHGAAWDGKSKGIYVNPGIYVFLADITMDDGIKRQFSGSLMLLR